jgi:glycine betaine/choline ABC-type transport system substrate-binding protein
MKKQKESRHDSGTFLASVSLLAGCSGGKSVTIGSKDFGENIVIGR